MLYKLLTPMGSGFFSLCLKMKVEGIENIPKDGAIIICPNHIHNLDPLLVAVAMRKVRPVRFMAKAELFKNKVVSSLLYQLGAFPVRRGKGDREALKTAGDILKNNECLGIFPEGRRRKTGDVQEAHIGTAMFALKYEAQVIPVGIKGGYQWFKPMIVSFGKPVDIDTYREEKISTEVSKNAMKIIVEEMDKLLR